MIEETYESKGDFELIILEQYVEIEFAQTICWVEMQGICLRSKYEN